MRLVLLIFAYTIRCHCHYKLVGRPFGLPAAPVFCVGSVERAWSMSVVWSGMMNQDLACDESHQKYPFIFIVFMRGSLIFSHSDSNPSNEEANIETMVLAFYKVDWTTPQHYICKAKSLRYREKRTCESVCTNELVTFMYPKPKSITPLERNEVCILFRQQ